MERNYTHKWRATYKFNGLKYEEGFMYKVSADNFAKILRNENRLKGKQPAPNTAIRVTQYPKRKGE